MSRIVTKRGDDGQTDWFGKTVSKSDLYIEYAGQLDTLESYLELLRFKLEQKSERKTCFCRSLIDELNDILYALHWSYNFYLPLDGKTSNLEQWIERYTKDEPKSDFTGLGGPKPNSEISLLYNICRSICRSCERATVRLLEREYEPSLYILGKVKYLNRLSDYLYVAMKVVDS
jgi:ATP:cob(I)alamin adenosyltransferase